MTTPTTQLILADTRIRQDAAGRYCLNDLHKAAVAAGANKRAKEPANFFQARRTQELLALLESSNPITGNSSNSGTELEARIQASKFGTSLDQLRQIGVVKPVVTERGQQGGTYVVIQLVIAYGQFVSAAFDLKVINTFLAVMHGQHAMPHIQSTKFWDLLRPHWAEIARLAMAGLKNTQIAPLVKRSVGSVGRCLRRMFDVGYLNPVTVFKARLSPATAARWALEKPVAAQWGRGCPSAQTHLDFGLSGAAS